MIQGERYFHALKRQVAVENHDRTFNEVLRIMYETEFIWSVPNDDNRIMDACELRLEWGIDKDFAPISVLEVTIALSRRMEFTVGGTAPGWAWQFMLNLELDKYPDPLVLRTHNAVGDILHALVWRTYQPDGTGGFFPLQDADDDQTQVEIWYQMAAYIDEILPE